VNTAHFPWYLQIFTCSVNFSCIILFGGGRLHVCVFEEGKKFLGGVSFY